MSDYISREAAVTIADYAADEHPYDKNPKQPETYSEYNRGWNDACDYIRDKLDDEKSADVEPVRHGRWKVVYPDGASCEGAALRTMYALLVCSECGKTFELMRMGKPRYCVCGAKMDLEGETNDD